MNRITAIEIAILVIAGLVPILWYHPGFIIANGDNFPIFLNAQKTFSSATNMWSTDYLGYATPIPSFLIYQYVGAFFTNLGLSAGAVQILFQVFLDIIAGLSIFYFTRVVYPNHKHAPFFAAFFYLFNFFILNFWFNLGFAWLYSFLPLLLGLLVSSVNAAYNKNMKAANIRIIIFILVSVAALSVASINPANVVLFLIAITVMGVYLLAKNYIHPKPFLLTLVKTVPLGILANMWWIFPTVMAFLISPQGLNTQVSIASWSWTHDRSSFLNLFWLNGTWGWSASYVPFFNLFVDPITQAPRPLTLLAFVPFIIAGIALLFKGNKSRFNAYIMFSILVFLFFAKGLNGLSKDVIANFLAWISEKLYTFPLMSMFREPASKFTLLIIPFLALLIGYSCDRITSVQLNLSPVRQKMLKMFVLLFIAGSFIAVCAPIFNFGTSPDSSLVYEPTSSYVKIPQYWYDASNWVNSQSGDGKVLFAPLNDFYQMPYDWFTHGGIGYYGTDSFIERLFSKPIISSDALDGYVSNGMTLDILRQIRTAEKFNQTAEFKTLLDITNVKYIIQRNDVATDVYDDNHALTSLVSMTNLKADWEMSEFFAEQPYLHLVKSFGPLAIYEYSEAKPVINALTPQTLGQINARISKSTCLNLSNVLDMNGWTVTASNQSKTASHLSQRNDTLQVATTTTLPNDWVKVDTPLVAVDSEASYNFNATVMNATSINSVVFKIAEYSQDKTLLENWTVGYIKWNIAPIPHLNVTNFVSPPFEPRTENTKFVNLQLWINATTNSDLWLNQTNILGTVSTLNASGLDQLYTKNNSTQLLYIKNLSPQKMIVTINTTQPFTLTTNQVLDRFWIANVNGQQIHPTTIYLGLKGFMINQTGQFDVIIEYQPQVWFNICLAISGLTCVFLLAILVYLNRHSFNLVGFFKKRER